MLATQSRSLTQSRPHWLDALRRRAWRLGEWLRLWGYHARRYRALSAGAGMLPRPAMEPARAGTTSLAIGVGRRFPIAPERARGFYRAADDLC